MSFRGRWYAAFAGDSDADTFDAAAGAENLYQHLYIAERPIARGRSPKRLGMLIARAESITKKCRAADFRSGALDPSLIDLTELVNRVMRLMAYDRKQENAVSKSVKDLLARRNLSLSWGYSASSVTSPVFAGYHIVHLEDKLIREQLVSDRLVSMVRRLFHAS